MAPGSPASIGIVTRPWGGQRPHLADGSKAFGSAAEAAVRGAPPARGSTWWRCWNWGPAPPRARAPLPQRPSPAAPRRTRPAARSAACGSAPRPHPAPPTPASLGLDHSVSLGASGEGPRKPDADPGSKKAGCPTPPPRFPGEGSTRQCGRGARALGGAGMSPGAGPLPPALAFTTPGRSRAAAGVVTKDPRLQPLVSASGSQFPLPLPPPRGWTPSCRGHGGTSVLSHVQPAPPRGARPGVPSPRGRRTRHGLGGISCEKSIFPKQ